MKPGILLVLIIGICSIVRADIIPSFVSATESSGNTVWSYQIDITTDQQVTTGDFFTIYDFGPFVAGSNVQPANWTFSSSNLGMTPAQTHAPDDPGFANLTWTYTGTTTIPTGTTLATFSVTTVGFNSLTQMRAGYFAAQATRNDGSGTKINNVGQLPVPIPEPSILSLLAMGVASGLAIYRRCR